MTNRAMQSADAFDELLQYVLLEGIGVAFTLIGFVIVTVAAFKLVRRDDIPGATLILASLVLTLLGSLASVGYSQIGEPETIDWAETAINIFLGFVFFLGAVGFWRLANHAAKR